MIGKEIIIQKGQTLSQIALANNTSVSELCKINNIKKPDLIFAGQKIITNADIQKNNPRENALANNTNVSKSNKINKNSDSIFSGQKTNTNGEKQLNIGGEIVGTGTAIEHLAPKSDIDKLKAAEKELKNAVKANTYHTGTSGTQYLHSKGPTAERQFKAYKNLEKAQKAYDEAETLIKTEKKLKAASKELNSAVKANTYHTSESGRIYTRSKGPTAIRQFRASENFTKAQIEHYKATSGKTNIDVKAIKTTRALSKASKLVGRAAVPLAAAAEGYNVYTEYKKGGKKAAAKQVVRSSGAIAGAWAGAKGGAAAGAAIGTFVPGVGNAVGAAVGGVIGGIAGYFAGDKIMKQIVK